MYAPRLKGQLKRVANLVTKDKFYASKKYKMRTKGKKDYHMGKEKINKLINGLKVEKKVYVTAGSGELGQVSANTSKAFFLDCTPNIKNGTGSGDRIGNKIEIKSIFIRCAVMNSSVQSAPVRFRAYLVQCKGLPYDNSGEFIEDFLKANPYIKQLNIGSDAIYDYFSPRNEKFFQRFKVLAQKEFRMKGDTVGGQNQQTEVKIGRKNLQIPCRWSADSTTVSSVPDDGQIVLIIVCDRGNYTGTCTLAGVLDTTSGTGYAVPYESTVYYTDA